MLEALFVLHLDVLNEFEREDSLEEEVLVHDSLDIDSLFHRHLMPEGEQRHRQNSLVLQRVQQCITAIGQQLQSQVFLLRLHRWSEHVSLLSHLFRKVSESVLDGNLVALLADSADPDASFLEIGTDPVTALDQLVFRNALPLHEQHRGHYLNRHDHDHLLDALDGLLEELAGLLFDWHLSRTLADLFRNVLGLS